MAAWSAAWRVPHEHHGLPSSANPALRNGRGRPVSLTGKADTAPVVVLAVGNPSRGDDAIGPYLLERLRDWLQQQPARQCVELIEDFQLNIEHALDLHDRRMAIFIDAGDHTPAPYTYTALAPAADLGASTHALEPGAVLRVFGQTTQQPAPPAFVLCVRGQAFDLGQPMSAAATAHADAAFVHLTRILGDAVGAAAPV